MNNRFIWLLLVFLGDMGKEVYLLVVGLDIFKFNFIIWRLKILFKCSIVEVKKRNLC